ncbi:MAG TPA: lysophospholipid acyltransferase family protein [Thermoanaerobaculia bacterium]|nr:lysophospholipid acyltransferase family protein [Thermoanaerobaculia bacterium]
MESWHYEPTPDFDKTPIERLRDFPRHPHFFVYWMRTFANLVVRAILRIGNRFEIAGRENLPSSGSFVMVANHASHLDAPSLLAALPLKQVHRAFPAAAADYFFTNLPVLAFSAIVMNAMPFDRRENPKQSIDACRQLLESEGHVLILFPEGTRTADGSIGPFKPGIGFLIAGSAIPVVPCHIRGAWKAWPKGNWIPRPRKLTLTIGKPLVFADKQRVKDDALAIAETLRSAVAALD